MNSFRKKEQKGFYINGKWLFEYIFREESAVKNVQVCILYSFVGISIKQIRLLNLKCNINNAE